MYGRFGPPKSRASRKPVPLHPMLAAMLEAWWGETPYARDGGFIFPSFRLRGREPPRANMLVADHRQPAARKAGIQERVRVQTL
jgi:integrase